MKNRREFLQELAGMLTLASMVPLVGCGNEERQGNGLYRLAAPTQVTMYDTHAMALYYDGTIGPKTGIIKVQYILDNVDVTLPFWHGHGGVNHRFTMTPSHFKEMKAMRKVTVETTVVDGHRHSLFIDFSDSKYRVAGATPIPVPV